MRKRKNGEHPAPPPIDFPNQGTLTGDLFEFPLGRSPRGEIFGNSTITTRNPDRVTFMVVMSHAGNDHKGYQLREFVVSEFYL